MTLRGIAREFQDFPATVFICMVWIMVFVTMIGSQVADGVPPAWLNLMLLGINAGHRFGDLALTDINQGEVWRLVTSTFVHYSVVHIAVNLFAFYQLGTLLESWYGTHQFIMIYCVTGGGGNLISVCIRYWNRSSPHAHSGGGSVVLMGLVALCAIAGFRSRTHMGKRLGWLMVISMVVTALLGIVLPRYLDNWGHLGGAVVGFAMGLGHPRFLRLASRPSAWGTGVVAGFVIAVCGVAQVVDDRREAPARQEQVVFRLEVLEQAFQYHPRTPGRFIDPQALLGRLDSLGIETVLDSGTRSDFMALRRRARLAQGQIDSADIPFEFEKQLIQMFKQVHRKLVIERSKLFQLHPSSFILYPFPRLVHWPGEPRRGVGDVHAG
jgi:membrane associated rhomboid family serine protease